MDRTLFSPAMVDTFRSCRKAYQMAFETFSASRAPKSLQALCRQFLRRGLAEINRGRVTNVNQVQIFLGQYWPLEKLEHLNPSHEQLARAFLYSYKTLQSYVRRPYLPGSMEVAAVALRIRARVPESRVYVEDTFDIVLWNPQTKHLELVEFQTRPIRHVNPLHPPASVLMKQFLCERLKVRWPFESLALTTIKVGPQGMERDKVLLDPSAFAVQWPSVVADLSCMKEGVAAEPHKPGENCKYCDTLRQNIVREKRIQKDEDREYDDDGFHLCMSA